MVEAFGLSDVGCVRTNNEDSFLTAPSLGLFLVADGMGGAKAGEVASKLAAETLWELVYKTGGVTDPGLLERAIAEANLRVVRAAASDNGKHGMGTTMTAVIVADDYEVLVGHVGDSRLYELRGSNLVQITHDQTWVNEVGRRLGLSDEALRKHPMRHVLTMAVGVTEELEVLNYRFRAKPGALLLLSSDGLHGIVPHDRIEATLLAEGPLEEKCKALVNLARARGGPDNVTVVLLRVPEGA